MTNGVLQLINGALGHEGLGALAQVAGQSRLNTSSALVSAVSAVADSLRIAIQFPGGTTQLLRSVRESDPTILADVRGHFAHLADPSSPAMTRATHLLRSTFGYAAVTAVHFIQARSGLDEKRAEGLLALAASLVMAWLSSQTDRNHLEAAQLRSLVQGMPELGSLRLGPGTASGSLPALALAR
jgi:hypothetical protein